MLDKTKMLMTSKEFKNRTLSMEIEYYQEKKIYIYIYI